MSLAPDAHLIVVGAGLAGYHAARGVRHHGHRGPITIFGEEMRPAYDRPALSKAYLTGAVAEDELLLDDPNNPLEADWVSGLGVVGLSGSADGTEPLGVRTADGAFHTADAIIITTGASARTLPAASTDQHPPEEVASARPYVLRSMDDALSLRQAPLAGADVAVLGGGFLALEAAATCTQRGAASVTVAAGEEHPGAKRLGTPVGRAIRAAHEAHGVRFAPPSRAQATRSTADGHEVMLADGTSVEAQAVICAIGASPRTEWLLGSHIVLTEDTAAVLCDDTGETSVPGVYAAGDCAQWASHSSGLRPVGHWQEAVEEAAVVAASLTGAEPASLQEPYFWSDQFDLRIQGAGRIHLADTTTVLEGSAAEGSMLVSYTRDGQEIGILGINRLRDVTRWRKRRRIRTAAPALAA